MTAPATSAQLLQQGLFHHRQGQLDLAMDRYTEVLRNDPNNADALYYVGVVTCQQGQFQQGADLARRAIANGAPSARVYNLLGRALEQLGDPLQAIKNFDQAIATDPNFAEAHSNRAGVLAKAGLPAEALQSFNRALALDANSTPDWINRGALLQDIGRHQEALASYDKALALAPKDSGIQMNRANALVMLGRMEDAEPVYDQIIKLTPKLHLAYAHKGLAVKQLGRFEEARKLLEQALAMQPDDHATAYALARLMLLMGDWRNAWPLFARHGSLPKPAYEPLAHPLWNGEPPADFRLVLMSEQKLGDTIQFARYAALLAGRGFPVTLLTQPVLAPLMRTLPGVERVIAAPDELKGDFRSVRWLPLMSTMPALFLTPKAIPTQQPYLRAEPERTAKWAQRLGPAGFKVGILWQGSTRDSIAPLAAFAPLADIPGVRLISLQKAPGAREIAEVAFASRVERVLDENDVGPDALLESAALIANLDLVVSIDSMPAHLAGALGRPVMLALPFVPDWRWFTAGDDTPWYAGMRLFRQDASRQWAPVFERIAAALRERAAG
jgi:tetratricopeptide (TPR) repeat protein